MSSTKNTCGYEFEAEPGFFIRYDAEPLGSEILVDDETIYCFLIASDPYELAELSEAANEHYDHTAMMHAAKEDFRKNHFWTNEDQAEFELN